MITMGTKQNPSENDFYAKALPDEPIFTFLARDLDAPPLIRKWAAARAEAVALGQAPPTDARIALEAFAVSIDMENWRRANISRIATPPSPPVTAPVGQKAIMVGDPPPIVGATANPVNTLALDLSEFSVEETKSAE